MVKISLNGNESQAARDVNVVIHNLFRFAISLEEAVGGKTVLEGVLNGWVHLELAAGYTVDEVVDQLRTLADALSEPTHAAIFEAAHQGRHN